MTYTHLSQSERYQIERWLQQGLHIIQISRLLNRAKSTIYRELKRLNVAYSAAGADIHRQQCASRSAANAPRIDAAAWQEHMRKAYFGLLPRNVSMTLLHLAS
jgi:transposase, IS30 family